MMAGKAQLFGDSEIREQILKCNVPKQIKALGRKVRSFDQKVWDKFKYAIVLGGNWCKFSQNPVQWRGQNLLGFALMEVRDELRRVTQNEMLCDWSMVWQQ